MNEENKTYQLNCLLSPLLSPEELSKLVQKIKREITGQEGSLVGEGVSAANPAKKRLAYPINKYQEAFFLNVDFVFPIQSVSQLKEQIASEENVIRCLIATKKKQAPQVEKTKDAFDFEMIDKIEPLSTKEISPREEITSKEEIKKNEAKDAPLESKRPTEQEAALKKDIPVEKQAKEKVKIEELDKKLEEILNQ
ncbi:MAG: 30S ribosomal protein S6 [Patescibacteria group bacterium]|nr:30S ribosomal protein S6 [Patescibacteria group bacterium]